MKYPLQIFYGEAFFQNEACREIERTRAAHRQIVDRAVDRQTAYVAARKEDGIDDVGIGRVSEPDGVLSISRATTRADLEDRLVFKQLQERVAQIFEEQTFDHLVHGAATAAVRQRDVRVLELVLSTPRPLDSLEQRRWRESCLHLF